ncbi:enoyl-CoA hydratase-related protein [Pseudodonghicola sp.]|uniref:enoyl-CoA hydratase/isomerase family protein n=1 Tax=Pseudodonghicola sp. TaxID=1969463 RepID=UPI003A976B7F
MYLSESLGPDGILTVTLADPSGPVNRTTAQFKAELGALLDRLEVAPVRGVIFLTDRPAFGVGGDVDQIAELAAASPAEIFADSQRIKALYRRIERLRLPVVALVEGLAVGGNFELALACHACFATDDDSIRLGFPECSIGLIPGAGGLVRLVHLLGIEAAIPLIVEARLIAPARAAELGLITGLCADRAGLMQAARDWIAANPAPQQPWDRRGHRVPGGGLFDRRGRFLAQQGRTSALVQAGHGRQLAEIVALSGICDVAACSFADGEIIESRLFARQAISREAEVRIGLRLKDRSVLKRASQPPDTAFAETLREALRDEIAALRGQGVPAALIRNVATHAGYDAGALGIDDAAESLKGDLPALADIETRLLTAQCCAALRALAEGALRSAAGINSGAVREAGFPAWTGGPLRLVEAEGAAAFLSRCTLLATELGARFAVPFATAAELQAALDAARAFDTETLEQQG